jgi:DNA-binding transcriptional LysR family regulator
METNHLREFVEFSKSMNYTTAAKKLFITQPALSSHIASLEKEIGAPLIVKRANHLVLTPAGKHLSGELEELLRSLQTMVTQSVSMAERILPIFIRNDTAYFDDILLRARKRFSENHPEKEIEFSITIPPGSRVEALEKGVIDFDIGRFLNFVDSGESIEELYDTEGLSYFLQKVEDQFFWISNESPLFHKEKIFAEDLRDCTLVTTADPVSVVLGNQMVRLFKEQNVPIQLTHLTLRTLFEYYYTDIKQGFGLVGESLARSVGLNLNSQTRRTFTIEGMHPRLQIYTVYCDDMLNQGSRDFIEALKEVAITTPSKK